MEDINQIKFALVKSKKTNKWVAEQLEVNPTTFSKWCTKMSQPNLYTLKKIAGLLNIVSE
jgi:putative toxin-antitoxin system, antitoxin component, xre family